MTTFLEKDAVLGVIGGMGPVASAEFLRTIYEQSQTRREQDAPKVILFSDPTIPDRTEAILSGNSAVLLERLTAAIASLCAMGASQVVICCMTIHHLLPQLPPHLRRRIISLLDVTLAGLKASQRKHLVICSKGAQKLRLFQRHPAWNAVQDLLVFPDEQDQDWIHYECIHQVKLNREVSAFAPKIRSLLTKYQVDRFVAACTEAHILSKYFAEADRPGCQHCSLDPLLLIAKDLADSSNRSALRVIGHE